MDDNISDSLRKGISFFEKLSENKLLEMLQGSWVVSYESNEAAAMVGEDINFPDKHIINTASI